MFLHVVTLATSEWIQNRRPEGGHIDADSCTHSQTEQSGNETTRTVSLTDCAQGMQMSSIDMKLELDYDSTVILTCKLLFAAAKAILDVGPDMPWQSCCFSSGLGKGGEGVITI